MKKILLLILVMAMARIGTAQQSAGLAIVPANGETTEKISNVPQGYAVVYFAKTAKATDVQYYVVLRPENDFDYSKFKLFSGTLASVSEIKNASFSQDDGMLTIHIAVGKLSFPRVGDIKLFVKDDVIDLQKLPRE